MRFPLTSRLPRTRGLATLRRSLNLLRGFRFEQTAPEVFYGRLAEDTALLLECLHADCVGGGLAGRRILDVGGGPGYFSQAFAARNCGYVTVEPDAGEMAAAGIAVDASVRGSGTALPFREGVFDVTYSSNVAEHVPDPWTMGEEMLRVTRPGGLVVLSYTVWLGPFGGHETGLIPHYIGGAYARDRYTRRHGHPPKNVFGQSLFDVSCTAGLRWARSTKAEVCSVFPRYHPAWAWWMVRVPILREFVVSNVVIVLRRKQ
ncbi:class I SAM-dependent methyltransferase [Corynebacterium sp. P5848]|uniref:class I SAM-dependent methyltransferase n=1 Tax=Corynebacterium marambiense TaxID=2765364 RepID=UPI002260A595|nr:class I SAM-dependent methyltransferase [Corynebacterium marambiense]MCX7542944.1 class I SAM-dependent methyltransferase [Corynebacterium marambiense]